MTFISRSFIRKRAISLAATTSVAVTSLALARDPTSGYHLRAAVPVQYVTDRPDYSREQPFLSAHQQHEIAVMGLSVEEKTSSPQPVRPGAGPESSSSDQRAMRGGMKNDSL